MNFSTKSESIFITPLLYHAFALLQQLLKSALAAIIDLIILSLKLHNTYHQPTQE
jgi:hypothetical protein